jgi:phage pi2 protein 07
MLAVAEVIGKARTYLGEVVPEFAALQPKVEEAEFSKELSNWTVTFSLPEGSNRKAASLADLLRNPRSAKAVSLEAEDGTLIAVKNRDL